MAMMPAIQIFGAARERRIYALPAYTPLANLAFVDLPASLKKSIQHVVSAAHLFIIWIILVRQTPPLGMFRLRSMQGARSCLACQIPC